MSIPIKAQLSLNGEANGWRALALLCDGSTYGVDEDMVIYEFSRSYMGQVAKQYLKDSERMYHELMRKANLVETQGDLLDADNLRLGARNYRNTKVLPARKFFSTFKSMSTAKVRNVPDSRKAQATPKKCGCPPYRVKLLKPVI
jgi:hypothetical protein